MSNEAAQDSNGTKKAHVNSAAINKDDLKPLYDAVRSLPTNAVKDLLSADVCSLCIFRLFGLHEPICSYPSLSAPIMGAIFQEEFELRGDEDSAMKLSICPMCLGILQFHHLDDKDLLVKNECAIDFANTVAEAVKHEHHQIDSFSLEISLPPLIMEKEKTVWLYMKNKYEMPTSDLISAKDVLKQSITDTLGALLGVKCNSESSFRIRLTYTKGDTSALSQDMNGNNVCNKRRKTESPNTHEDQINRVIETSQGINTLNIHLIKVNQPCRLTFLCNRSPIYIGGRYLKYSRNVSQSRWIIDDERMGEASVEEIIGNNVLPLCKGDSYKFHAAGREDIDVRMLGTGRPFLVEIQNAREIPSSLLMKDIELKINTLNDKLVRVKNLKSLGEKGWDLMREGEAEKQKQYVALVWISRELNDDDLQNISSLKDMKIMQKTPVRVLHRRSPLEREKIIHWMRIEKIMGSSQYFLLHLCTQAGTYIKEFVHSDLGRTNPSVGSILGCRAEIVQLDVTDVKMDCFQDE